MRLKREQQLIDYFTQMEFTDILGFAAIVGAEVKEDEPFEDFIVDIIARYSELPRSKRRALLKLAADVVGANKEIKKSQESHKKLGT